MIMYTNNKGIVLISVLFIVLILSAIGASMSKTYLISIKRESYVDFQSNAIQYINNVETLAKEELKKQFRPVRSYTSKSMPIFANLIRLESESGYIVADIADASTCYNINSVVDFANQEYMPNDRSIKGLKKLLELLKYDESEINELIDQMIDWIDKDSQPRNYGLEDYYYTGPMSEIKQYPSERLFYDLSELRSLPASRFLNWLDVQKHLCAFPVSEDTRVNFNMLETKHDVLLAALIPGLSVSDAGAMIEQIPLDGFTTVQQLYSTFPNISFNESHLPIGLSSNLIGLSSSIANQEYEIRSNSVIELKNNQAIVISRFYN